MLVSQRWNTEKKVLLYQQSHSLKKGEQKYFVTTTKCLVLSTKRLVAAAKFLVEAAKNSFGVPDFVAVTKPFSREVLQLALSQNKGSDTNYTAPITNSEPELESRENVGDDGAPPPVGIRSTTSS